MANKQGTKSLFSTTSVSLESTNISLTPSLALSVSPAETPTRPDVRLPDFPIRAFWQPGHSTRSAARQTILHLASNSIKPSCGPASESPSGVPSNQAVRIRRCISSASLAPRQGSLFLRCLHVSFHHPYPGVSLFVCNRHHFSLLILNHRNLPPAAAHSSQASSTAQPLTTSSLPYPPDLLVWDRQRCKSVLP